MITVDPISRCVKSSEGFWLPPICLKQHEVFVNGNRFLLVSGPRLSGKTEAILHKILKHAFDVPGSRTAIITKTTKTGKSGGVWQDLTQRIIPIWLRAGIGFSLIQEPKVTGDTRQNMFVVRSRFGPASEVLLHSLEFAPEVDEKLRGTKYSMVWFSEIDQIAPESGTPPDRDDRMVFASASAQLRMEPEVAYEAHQIIMDCNPPEDGEDNWLHKIFVQEKEDPNHPDKEYQEQLHHIEFSIDDNPFLDPRSKTMLYNQYRYRQSLLDRLYYGKWKKDLTGGHFSEMFKPEVHVLGKIECQEEEREIIYPSAACKLLLSGLDLGDRNNSFHIGEKLETKEGDRIITKFAIIDELVITGRHLALRVLVDAMVAMIDKWEKYCKDEYGRTIAWRHWSDEAAFHYKQVAEATDMLVVRNMSGGKIQLRPAPKYKGSIRDRVALVQHLLFENRLYFSAQLNETITMLKVLRQGNTVADYVAPPRHTHAFDSLTYMLQSEAPVDEVQFGEVKTDRAPRRLVMAT